MAGSPLDRPPTKQGSCGPADVKERVIALYESHREGIYRFLVGHGLSPGEAQDLTQDVFLDLFVALDKGAELKSEQAWLYAVAGRAVVDHWRRERQVRAYVDLDTNPAVNIVSREPSPEAQTEIHERRRRLAAGLARLPNEQRLCVQLRMQGLRYREIAQILGVATSTAADWLVAAVKYLRRETQ